MEQDVYKRQGLVEGFGEVVGDEDGQVGVLALLLLEAVAIDHGQIVVVVLLSHIILGHVQP